MTSDIGREDRRKRILERGSDRLAQITGQSKAAFDPSPSPSTTVPNNNPTRSPDHPYFHAHSEDADGKHTSELIKGKANNEVLEGRNFGLTGQMDPNLHNIVANAATVGAPGSNKMTRQQSPGVVLPAQKLSNHSKFFSCKRINTCILSSERTRVVCSLIIASLVVMSYIDYPLFGVNIVSSESVIAYRPLYILLLTDVTIVFTRMFHERISSSEGAEETNIPHHEGDNWDGAVKLLERSLVVYQAIRGLFIDCSVYFVMVICFHSIV